MQFLQVMNVKIVATNPHTTQIINSCESNIHQSL
jgi:hypothetical protein